jgi:hypothetical protein
MNNEPVAWMLLRDEVCSELTEWFGDMRGWEEFLGDNEKIVELYTHPVKELKNIVLSSATCSCGKVMEVTNLQAVKELTDEEIGQIWKDCMESPYMQISNPVGFARAILRKAQENG